MVELCVRVCGAAALMVWAGALMPSVFELAWRVAVLFAACSFLLYAIERKGLRNAGVSGLVASLDAGFVAVVLAATGQLQGFGFLVLLPVVYAHAIRGSDATAMAPIAAAWVIAAHWIVSSRPLTSGLLVQSALILVIGLMLGARRSAAEAEASRVAPAASEAERADYLNLRENFRKLRDQFADLQREARQNAFIAQVCQMTERSPSGRGQALAARLVEWSGAKGVALYVTAPSGEGTTFYGSAGAVRTDLPSQPLTFPKGFSEAQMKDRATEFMRSLRDPEQPGHSATVLLRASGKLVGLAILFHSDPKRLDDCVAETESVAGSLALAMETAMRAEANESRRRLAELLYEIATLLPGTTSEAQFIARVTHEVAMISGADYVAAMLFDGDDLTGVATYGEARDVWRVISFSRGSGPSSWRASGAPEVLVSDPRQDTRCSPEECLQQRIGSFAIVPIQRGGDVDGFVVVASSVVRGLSEERLSSIRAVVYELSDALGRQYSDLQTSGGIATPREFSRAIANAESGSIVVIEVLRRERVEQGYGRPAIAQALASLARCLRTKLPPGGLVCRRPEGDLLVWLDSCDADTASRWANQAAALASMIRLQRPQGGAAPLAVRARVAQISPQKGQNLPLEVV